jgi:hypothetical protein
MYNLDLMSIAFANALKLAFTWLELIVVLGVKVFGTFTGAYEVTGMTKKANTNSSKRCLDEERFLLKYVMVIPPLIHHRLESAGKLNQPQQEHRIYSIQPTTHCPMWIYPICRQP